MKVWKKRGGSGGGDSAFLWSAEPTLVREHLTRTRNYAKRTGPPTPEGCFQDILSVGKQVEESAEDERRAQQAQKEKHRMSGNLDTGTRLKTYEVMWLCYFIIYFSHVISYDKRRPRRWTM